VFEFHRRCGRDYFPAGVVLAMAIFVVENPLTLCGPQLEHEQEK